MTVATLPDDLRYSLRLEIDRRRRLDLAEELAALEVAETRVGRGGVRGARLPRARPTRGIEGRPLTERELQVIEAAATGEPIDVTAERLSVAIDTLRTHRRKALDKLGARNIAHAVGVAFRRGLLQMSAGSIEI